MARPDPDRWVAVATTRPETLLGDVAVAVHPDDERYRSLVGQRGDPARSSAAACRSSPTRRSTPSSAPGRSRSRRPTTRTTTRPASGTAWRRSPSSTRRRGSTRRVASSQGLDRFEARRRIVERLADMGDLESEQPHQMVVGHCERCGTVVEPRLSVQWFIRTADLAARALASVREGRTRIVPAALREGVRPLDGEHPRLGGRPPAVVGAPHPGLVLSRRPHHGQRRVGGAERLRRPAAGRRPSWSRSPTSSTPGSAAGLWPFSTLGWPDDTPDLRRFYPTSVMETGYDILFFWVARMMMLGLFLTDVEPFHTVYLHGLVRAQGGVKMSKTKGNVTDPVELIDEIGADAVRLALTTGTSAGQRPAADDGQARRGAELRQQAVERRALRARQRACRRGRGARRTTQASRRPHHPSPSAGSALAWRRSPPTPPDRLDRLDLGGYAGAVTEFAWSDFCDWYLEMAKIELRDPSRAAGRGAAGVADRCRGAGRHAAPPASGHAVRDRGDLGRAGSSRRRSTDELLMSAPVASAPADRDQPAEEEFAKLAEVVRAARNLRTEAGVPAGATRRASTSPRPARQRRGRDRGRPSLPRAAGAGRAAGCMPEARRCRRDGGARARRLGAIWLEERRRSAGGPTRAARRAAPEPGPGGRPSWPIPRSCERAPQRSSSASGPGWPTSRSGCGRWVAAAGRGRIAPDRSHRTRTSRGISPPQQAQTRARAGAGAGVRPGPGPPVLAWRWPTSPAAATPSASPPGPMSSRRCHGSSSR